MPVIKDEQIVAPRYAHGFHCIGGACEDDCCHGWQIAVDRSSFKKLKRAMGKTGAEREQFRKGIKRNRSSDSDTHYATLANGENGDCVFLDPKSRLCLIHGKYGEDCLSDVCMTYPRNFTRKNDGLELSMAISCPEVARLCLLSETSMDVLPFENSSEAGKRYLLGVDLSGKTEDPYFLHFDTVREVFLQLLAYREYPLAARLYFCAYFSGRINSFFYCGSQADVAGLLADEIDRLVGADLLEKLHQQLQNLQAPIDWSMSALLTILNFDMGKMDDQKSVFGQLLRKVWGRHGVLDGEVLSFPQKDGDLDFTAVTECYQGWRDKVQSAFGAELDLYLENYTRNYWLSESRLNWPSISEHIQDMFIRLATAKFLLCSHPDMVDLLENMGPEVDAASRNRFAELVVEVFYVFSRGREHNPVFKKKILELIQENQMQSLAHQVLFLKI